MNASTQTKWFTACSSDDLVTDSGVAVIIEDKQIALFFIPCQIENKNKVYAVDNFCPVSSANVISRGIVGDTAGEVVVASPIYKQHFSLINGQCIEDENFALNVYPAEISNGQVRIAL